MSVIFSIPIGPISVHLFSTLIWAATFIFCVLWLCVGIQDFEKIATFPSLYGPAFFFFFFLKFKKFYYFCQIKQNTRNLGQGLWRPLKPFYFGGCLSQLRMLIKFISSNLLFPLLSVCSTVISLFNRSRQLHFPLSQWHLKIARSLLMPWIRCDADSIPLGSPPKDQSTRCKLYPSPIPFKQKPEVVHLL